MKTIKKILATICAIICDHSRDRTLPFNNFDRSLSLRDLSKAFAREDFYNKLPSVMADAMTLNCRQSQFPVVNARHEQGSVGGFLPHLFPPDTLK